MLVVRVTRWRHLLLVLLLGRMLLLLRHRWRGPLVLVRLVPVGCGVALKFVHLAPLVLTFPQSPGGRIAYLVPGAWLWGLVLDRAPLARLAAVAAGGAHRIAFLGPVSLMPSRDAERGGGRGAAEQKEAQTGRGAVYVQAEGGTSRGRGEGVTHQFSASALVTGCIAREDAMRVAVMHHGRRVDRARQLESRSRWDGGMGLGEKRDAPMAKAAAGYGGFSWVGLGTDSLARSIGGRRARG